MDLAWKVCVSIGCDEEDYPLVWIVNTIGTYPLCQKHWQSWKRNSGDRYWAWGYGWLCR